jgi:hypothetical protein
MVEYVSVLTAVSLLVLTVGGQLGQRTAGSLPATTTAALPLLASGARAQQVPVAGAKAAYKRAPFGKPILRYLYATGWIGGVKNRSSCLLTRVTQDSARQEAVGGLRSKPKLMSQLRRRNVTAEQGASALVQGVISACS